MRSPNIFTNPELLRPPPEVVLALIKKHSGLSMEDLHALGYRSVFCSLQHLLNEDLIFLHNCRYLPNQ